MRAIAAGEEITTAYCDLAATRWERRAVLLRDYQFDLDLPEDEGGADAGSAAAAGTSDSAATAAATASSSSASAALQCMPVLPPSVTLRLEGAFPQRRRQLQLQQQGGEPGAELSGELRLYHRCSRPPWPHDPQDAELTAVVLPSGAPTSSGSSGTCRCVGGMWGRVQGEHQQQQEQQDAEAEADGLSFGLEGEAAGGLTKTATAVPVGGGAAAVAASAAAAQDGQAPAITVHAWLPDDGGAELAPRFAELAWHYAAALHLQQQVDALIAGRQAAAAAEQLRQQLRALACCGGGGGGGSGSGLALGPRHILRLRLLADLHRAAIAAGEWEGALSAGRQLLPLYQAVYPEVGGWVGGWVRGVGVAAVMGGGGAYLGRGVWALHSGRGRCGRGRRASITSLGIPASSHCVQNVTSSVS